MTFDGTVHEGKVILEPGVQLPEGTRVQVVIAEAALEPPTCLSLLKLAGTAQSLPADFAEQHDHYLYGTPKR